DDRAALTFDHGLLREREFTRSLEHLVESPLSRRLVVHSVREDHELLVTEQFDETLAIALLRQPQLKSCRQHQNSFPSGSANTNRRPSHWPFSTLRAPSEINRSTSVSRASSALGARSRWRRAFPVLATVGGPKVMNGPRPSGARIATSPSWS